MSCRLSLSRGDTGHRRRCRLIAVGRSCVSCGLVAVSLIWAIARGIVRGAGARWTRKRVARTKLLKLGNRGFRCVSVAADGVAEAGCGAVRGCEIAKTLRTDARRRPITRSCEGSAGVERGWPTLRTVSHPRRRPTMEPERWRGTRGMGDSGARSHGRGQMRGAPPASKKVPR